MQQLRKWLSKIWKPHLLNQFMQTLNCFTHYVITKKSVMFNCVKKVTKLLYAYKSKEQKNRTQVNA